MNKSDELHGILFGSRLGLRYLDLNEKKMYTLDEGVGSVNALYACENEVYYGVVKDGEKLVPRVKSLFGDFESEERDYPVTAMVKHKGRFLDAES